MKPKAEVINISGVTESGIHWTSTVISYGPGSKFTRGPIDFIVGSERRRYRANYRESFDTVEDAKRNAEQTAASIKVNS